MYTRFHPFQGRPSFGLRKLDEFMKILEVASFHPFQGRPSFGLPVVATALRDYFRPFPSLSGKTFIRTPTEI